MESNDAPLGGKQQKRSNFTFAKIQGALGLALGPCVLFSALACSLVGGLAVAGVAVAGRVCPLLVETVGFWLARWLLSVRTERPGRHFLSGA